MIFTQYIREAKTFLHWIIFSCSLSTLSLYFFFLRNISDIPILFFKKSTTDHVINPDLTTFWLQSGLYECLIGQFISLCDILRSDVTSHDFPPPNLWCIYFMCHSTKILFGNPSHDFFFSFDHVPDLWIKSELSVGNLKC